MRVLTIVNSAIDTDGPHARGVSVAVTIVLFSAVSGSPHVNVTQSVPALKKRTRDETRLTNDNKNELRYILVFFSFFRMIPH